MVGGQSHAPQLHFVPLGNQVQRHVDTVLRLEAVVPVQVAREENLRSWTVW
jgi:hypothetical protein